MTAIVRRADACGYIRPHDGHGHPMDHRIYSGERIDVDLAYYRRCMAHLAETAPQRPFGTLPGDKHPHNWYYDFHIRRICLGLESLIWTIFAGCDYFFWLACFGRNDRVPAHCSASRFNQ